MRWPPLFAQACFWICLVGIAFTQSRQAMAGLAVALIVIVMRTHNSGRERRSKVILLAVAAGMGFILVMVRDQVASGNEFNSVLPARRLVRGVDPHLADQPAVRRRACDGGTPTGSRPAFQPPNAVLEMLSTAGLVGLVGFVVLMVGSLVVLWRMDPRYGLVAFVVILSRLVQGQLDLFWVAVQTSIPFLIVGICLGAHGRELADQPPASGRPPSSPTARTWPRQGHRVTDAPTLDIVHVCCTNAFAGVERHVSELAAAQVALGHRVTVVGGHQSPRPGHRGRQA